MTTPFAAALGITKMTPDQFREWRRALGYSQRAAAEALGLSLVTVQIYERGRTYVRDAEGEQRDVEIPRVVELACECYLRRARLFKSSRS